jgi:RNA recognition motif-containing protein
LLFMPWVHSHFQVKVPVDRESGRSRGFAFVSFSEAGAVDEALKLAGSELLGRMIRVNLCNEPVAKTQQQNRE